MCSILPSGCLQEMFQFQNMDTILLVSKISVSHRDESYLFLKNKYHHLIDFFRQNQYPFTFQENDLEYLQKHTSSLELQILGRLLSLYSCHENMIGNEQMLWVNRLRFRVNNNHHGHVLNVFNKYIGMGHDYALLHLEKSDHFWLDFQGGSNGYEYDDNLKRITEVKLETVPKMSLVEALGRLFRFRF